MIGNGFDENRPHAAEVAGGQAISIIPVVASPAALGRQLWHRRRLSQDGGHETQYAFGEETI
jgi:hypothetical protein